MGNFKKLEWRSVHGKIEDTNIQEVEKALGIQFPDDYIQCIKENNGGHPIKEVYDFGKHKEAVFDRLLNFLPEKPNYIVHVYNSVIDRMLKDIYCFAEDPFGNLICFDYREKDRREPSIVFWDHEIASESPEKAISHVCDSFSQLLNILY